MAIVGIYVKLLGGNHPFCWKDIHLIIDSHSNTKIDIFIENLETISCWVFHFQTSTTSKNGGLEDLFPFQMGDFRF